MKKISILIPCLNEERGIGKVIDDIPIEKLRSLGFETDIIVIDNNSTDKTAVAAKKRNVRVVHEPHVGKGHAIRTGFDALADDSQYVVMLDGDNTYKPKEIFRLIEPLESNFCDVIIGSRLGGKVNENSLKFANRLANWTYTFLVRHIYRANVTDVLSGYFAWKKPVVDDLKPHLRANGFSIEMEMITKIVRLGYEIYSVPITYDQREGETKLKSLRDGIKIFRTFLRNLFWDPRTSQPKPPEEDIVPGGRQRRRPEFISGSP